jgi:conjugal transfer pilus assembly protein TraW
MMRAATLLLLFMAMPAGAIDLGRYGELHAIAERDVVEVMKEKMRQKVASGEWAKIRQGMQTRARAMLNDPPAVAGLATATAERSYLFDPSIVLSRPIIDPDGRTLFPAGTRVNPLEVVSLAQPLLFFDARDPRQRAVADRLRATHEEMITPILVAGAWESLSKTWQHPVYFDQQGLLVRRLGIQAVPALVTQEGTALRVVEFAP